MPRAAAFRRARTASEGGKPGRTSGSPWSRVTRSGRPIPALAGGGQQPLAHRERQFDPSGAPAGDHHLEGPVCGVGEERLRERPDLPHQPGDRPGGAGPPAHPGKIEPGDRAADIERDEVVGKRRPSFEPNSSRRRIHPHCRGQDDPRLPPAAPAEPHRSPARTGGTDRPRTRAPCRNRRPPECRARRSPGPRARGASSSGGGPGHGNARPRPGRPGAPPRPPGSPAPLSAGAWSAISRWLEPGLRGSSAGGSSHARLRRRTAPDPGGTGTALPVPRTHRRRTPSGWNAPGPRRRSRALFPGSVPPRPLHTIRRLHPPGNGLL